MEGNENVQEGFYERALAEAKSVQPPRYGEDQDETEALRGRLRKGLRRQPGDVRELMRHAESLSRISAAEHRLSPGKTRDLAERFRAVLEQVGDQILPPD